MASFYGTESLIEYNANPQKALLGRLLKRSGKMSYKILFTTQAAQQLQDAFNWYETQRQLLGWEFIEEFSNVIDKITNDKVAYKVF